MRRAAACTLALLVLVVAAFAAAAPAYASAPYLSTGTITSANLLAGESASSITDFYYDLTALPGNSSVTVQFSKDDSTWYSSAGVLAGSDTLSTLNGATVSLAALGWSGTAFYYRITLNATSDLTGTPTVSGVRLDYVRSPGYEGMLAVDSTTGNVEVGGGGGAGGSALSVVGGAAIGPDYFSHKTTNGIIVEGNAGVGTYAPSSQLTLDNSGNGKFFEALNSGVASGKGGLVFSHYSDSSGGTDVTIGNNYYLNSSGAVTRQDVTNSGWDMEMGNRTSFNGFSLNYINSSGTASNFFTITSGGSASVGTSTPYSRLEVWGPDSAASTSAFLVANAASTTEFSVLDNGNATLAGNLIQNSDQRLKTDIRSLAASSSLAAIEQLDPVTFNWIDPNKGTTPQLGFIAQQVQSIFPDLVSTTSATALTPGGTLSLNYIGLIAPIVSAIKEISSISGDFEQNLIAWLGSAGNGVGDLFAKNLYAENELCINKSNGTPVCISGDQLAAVLAATGQSSASAASGTGSGSAGPMSDIVSRSSTTSTPTPPEIQVNGANPAIIQVGATYNDLGATITGPTADLNLGIHTFVNGVQTEPVTLDTSAAATDTIAYVVTDQSGLTATSTRQVIVQAAATGAGDSSSASTDATTTDATSTTTASTNTGSDGATASTSTATSTTQ